VQSSLGILLILAACGGDDTSGPGRADRIVFTPDHPAIGQGLDLQLHAKLVDASNTAVAGAITFASADTALATVSETGRLHAVGPAGSVFIRATGAGITDSVSVAISQRLVELRVTPESLVLNRFFTAQLTVEGLDFQGNVVPVPVAVGFYSSNGSVISVDSSGAIAAHGLSGRVAIIASAGAVTGASRIQVTQIPDTLIVDQPRIVLAPGGTAPFSAAVLDLHGDTIGGAPIVYQPGGGAPFTVAASGQITAGAIVDSGTLTVSSGALIRSIPVVVDTTPQGGSLVKAIHFLEACWGAAISSNGQALVSTGASNRFWFGTMQDLNLTTPVNLPDSSYGVTINHAQTRGYIATDGRVAVADMANQTRLGDLPPFGGGIRFAVAVSNDDQHLYVGTDGGIYDIDLSTGKAVDSLVSARVEFLAIDPAQQRLFASVTGIGVEEILLGATMSVGRTFTVASPQGLAVSPDGAELYVTSNTANDLEVWNLTTGLRSRQIDIGAPGFGVATSRYRIAVTLPSGYVKLIARSSKAVLATVFVGGEPALTAWEATGSVLLVSNRQGSVQYVR